jgi:hypothetical protein
MAMGRWMQLSPGIKLAVVGTIIAGSALALSACGTKGQGGGPDSALTDEFMKDLHPDSIRGVRQLSLATDSRHTYKDTDGRIQGTMDGTRLLAAADAHAYGTPTITDPLVDKQGDGFATFNEIRQVVSHFDANANDEFEPGETTAFQAAVGIDWLGGQ